MTNDTSNHRFSPDNCSQKGHFLTSDRALRVRDADYSARLGEQPERLRHKYLLQCHIRQPRVTIDSQPFLQPLQSVYLLRIPQVK